MPSTEAAQTPMQMSGAQAAVLQTLCPGHTCGHSLSQLPHPQETEEAGERDLVRDALGAPPRGSVCRAGTSRAEARPSDHLPVPGSLIYREKNLRFEGVMHFLRLFRAGQINKNTENYMGYYFTPTRMTVLRKMDNKKCRRGCGRNWSPRALLATMEKRSKYCEKRFGSSSQSDTRNYHVTQQPHVQVHAHHD